MPRPQTPLAKAKLTGADKKDPKRFSGRSDPATSGKPVGNPPGHLSKSAANVWREAAKSMGWLVEEDRFALEVMAIAVGAIRDAGDQVTASMISAANTAIGKVGASPVDRSKVFQKASEPEEDEFEKFMQ